MDASSPSIIEYAFPVTSVDQLQLVEEEYVVRVIFPAPPAWHFPMKLASMLLNFGMPVITVGGLFYMLRRLNIAGGTAVIGVLGSWNVALNLLIGIIGTILIAHEIRMFRRWGRVSRVLIVEPGQIMMNWLGFRGMRSLSWSVESPNAIELQTVKDLFTRKPHCTLIIRCRKWLPLRFVLATKDADLPEKILTELRAVLSKKPETASSLVLRDSSI